MTLISAQRGLDGSGLLLQRRVLTGNVSLNLAGRVFAYFDAATAASVTLDGSQLVSQWSDLSGNARHIAQNTAASRPGYETGYALTFNGSQWLNSGAGSILTFGDLFVVASRLATSESILSVGTGGNRGFAGNAFPTFTTHGQYSSNGRAFITLNPSAILPVPGQLSLLAGRNRASPTTGPHVTSVGFDSPGFQPLRGRVCCALFLTETANLTADEYDRLCAFLCNRFRIGYRLPNTNPYKFTNLTLTV